MMMAESSQLGSAASRFFESGSLGYSATADRGAFDGIRLLTSAWAVSPVTIDSARSSFFDDPDHFPPGSAVLDDALVMRHVPVDWAAAPRLVAATKTTTRT